MATVDKNFRIKNGLVVEGTTGTINGNNILTESAGDSYILNLVGGSTLVKSVDSTTFTVDGSGNLTVNSGVFDVYGAASSAQTAAQSYADGLASNYDAAGAAATAESNANIYTDGQITSALTAAQGYATTAQGNAESYADAVGTSAVSSANTYTDGKVADLVGMAPSLLNTLEKIDAAIANDANFSTTLLNDIATAQSTAESYTDTAISTEVTNRNSAIATAKTEALTSAESYAEGLASNYDAAGSAGSAQSAAESYADSLVQNGNSSATPTYQALNLGNYTELVSGWSSTSNGSTFVPLSWNANYGTAKLTVHVRDGVHSQASEVLIARDSANNIAITEYAIITTNGALADISAIYAGGVISLTVSPINGHTTVESVASGSVVVWAD